ncbi:hypothetical protein CMI47_11810 [Candidatus Pacearchaeota archaeon]|nr:hypothetical protein [Candidatus Pacearchaeota archaeon]
MAVAGAVGRGVVAAPPLLHLEALTHGVAVGVAEAAVGGEDRRGQVDGGALALPTGAEPDHDLAVLAIELHVVVAPHGGAEGDRALDEHVRDLNLVVAEGGEAAAEAAQGVRDGQLELVEVEGGAAQAVPGGVGGDGRAADAAPGREQVSDVARGLGGISDLGVVVVVVDGALDGEIHHQLPLLDVEARRGPATTDEIGAPAVPVEDEGDGVAEGGAVAEADVVGHHLPQGVIREGGHRAERRRERQSLGRVDLVDQPGVVGDALAVGLQLQELPDGEIVGIASDDLSLSPTRRDPHGGCGGGVDREAAGQEPVEPQSGVVREDQIARTDGAHRERERHRAHPQALGVAAVIVGDHGLCGVAIRAGPSVVLLHHGLLADGGEAPPTQIGVDEGQRGGIREVGAGGHGAHRRLDGHAEASDHGAGHRALPSTGCSVGVQCPEADASAGVVPERERHPQDQARGVVLAVKICLGLLGEDQIDPRAVELPVVRISEGIAQGLSGGEQGTLQISPVRAAPGVAHLDGAPERLAAVAPPAHAVVLGQPGDHDLDAVGHGALDLSEGGAPWASGVWDQPAAPHPQSVDDLLDESDGGVIDAHAIRPPAPGPAGAIVVAPLRRSQTRTTISGSRSSSPLLASMNGRRASTWTA